MQTLSDHGYRAHEGCKYIYITCEHRRPVNQDLVAMYGTAQGLNSLAGALGRRAIELYF